MTEDPEDYATADRGQRARALLDNELIDEAFTELDKRLWDAFKALNPRDNEGLQYVRRMTQTLRDFRGHFEELVTLGENAEARIKDSERRSVLRHFVA